MTASSVKTAVLSATAQDRFARLLETASGHQVLIYIEAEGPDTRHVQTITSVAGLQITEKATITSAGNDNCTADELDDKCITWMNEFTQERANEFVSAALDMLVGDDEEGDDDGA